MDEFSLKSGDVTLVEVLDRVLNKGVVISGDIVISVADVDLIYLGLRVLVSSVETMEKMKRGEISQNSEQRTANSEQRTANSEQ